MPDQLKVYGAGSPPDSDCHCDCSDSRECFFGQDLFNEGLDKWEIISGDWDTVDNRLVGQPGGGIILWDGEPDGTNIGMTAQMFGASANQESAAWRFYFNWLDSLNHGYIEWRPRVWPDQDFQKTAVVIDGVETELAGFSEGTGQPVPEFGKSTVMTTNGQFRFCWDRDYGSRDFLVSGQFGGGGTNVWTGDFWPLFADTGGRRFGWGTTDQALRINQCQMNYRMSWKRPHCICCGFGNNNPTCAPWYWSFEWPSMTWDVNDNAYQATDIVCDGAEAGGTILLTPLTAGFSIYPLWQTRSWLYDYPDVRYAWSLDPTRITTYGWQLYRLYKPGDAADEQRYRLSLNRRSNETGSYGSNPVTALASYITGPKKATLAFGGEIHGFWPMEMHREPIGSTGATDYTICHASSLPSYITLTPHSPG